MINCKKLNLHYARWGFALYLAAGAVVLSLVVGGCSALSTEGENYAGVNYANVTMPTGEKWLVAGGKDGTNVALTVKTTSDGTREVSYSADNLDATSVLAQANSAMAERLATMTDLILRLPAPGPL